MKSPTTRLLLLSAFTLLFGSIAARAAVISFEDLTTRDNFDHLGISNTYLGYSWGKGTSAGVAGRTYANTGSGWASATASSTAVTPPPTGLDGTSYAWNWNGLQSLWINFGGSVDFTSGDFSTLSSAYGNNASTIQLFGYDAADNLIAVSSVLGLANNMQTLTANFSGIQSLEIRANANQWFSVDSLVINENNTVPETSSSLALLGGALVVFASLRRRVLA